MRGKEKGKHFNQKEQLEEHDMCVGSDKMFIVSETGSGRSRTDGVS